MKPRIFSAKFLVFLDFGLGFFLFQVMKNSIGGKGSMSTASSITTWKAGDVVSVPDQFPAGLRVLVVDDDPTCLIILEKMLRNCSYDGSITTFFLGFSLILHFDH